MNKLLVCLVAVAAVSALAVQGADVEAATRRSKHSGIGSPAFQELQAKVSTQTQTRRNKKWIVPLAAGMGLAHMLGGDKKSDHQNVIKGAANAMQSMGAAMRVAKAAAAGKLTTPAFMISQADQQCVICQYLVERVRGEMLVQGIGGGVPFAAGPNMDAMNQAGIPGQFTPPPSLEGSAAAAPAPAEGEAPAESSLLQVLDGVTSKSKHPGLAQKASAFLNSIKAHAAEPEQLPSQRARTNEMLMYRPTQVRYANLYDGPVEAMKRAKDRFENNQMYSLVYHAVEGVCSKSVPKPFYAYCGSVLQNYKDVAQGLRNKDRPDAICMRMEFCNKQSYVQRGPHAVYRQA